MRQHIITLSMNCPKSAPTQKAPFATLLEQLARKEHAQHFLRRMGLDAKQFVLFLELFRTLSMREEFMGSIGVNRFNITYLAYWAAWMELYIVTFLLMKRAVPRDGAEPGHVSPPVGGIPPPRPRSTVALPPR